MAAEKTYGEDAAQAAEASGGLPQFDLSTWSSQIFWLVVTFGLLYFILARFILPRIGEGITERSDRLADDMDAASRMQKEAEQAELAYERVMSNAKAKAHNISETTRKSVDEEVNRDIEAAEAEFASKQALAEARISDIRQAALANIDDVARDTTAAIVEKIGNIKPSAAKVKTAVSNLRG